MILRAFLILYRLAWIPLLPLVLVYLWHRGRRDPAYLEHLSERFGFYDRPLPQEPLWFHAVSLGEVRSAVGLIRLALERGDKVVLTHFTPAGRSEARRQFGAEIASGQLASVWVPFDLLWCYRRFFRACRPRIGLTLEVEIWPGMIQAARRSGIPLYMCNAQYAEGPLARDSRGLRLRQRVLRGLSGAFVKSARHAARFESVGLKNIEVTGELRFDQPLPEGQLEAANRLREALAGDREVIAIASGVEDEEALYLGVISKLLERENGAPPFFVYVPRAPERFDAVAAQLRDADLAFLRRSEALDEDLAPRPPLPPADILLGDSLGEMFFFLALSDRVVVGAGFTPKGAHNIIEPLMLGKPVVTGPYTWVIEFPFVEAEAAGVAASVPDAEALLAALDRPPDDRGEAIRAFLDEHRGASRRTLDAIDRVLAMRG